MNSAIGQSPVWAASKAEWAEAAQFFARVIAADASYISYGEMQTGLSPDGRTWAPDLEQRFLAELGSFDGTRGLAIMRDASGKIVAAANITWSFETADAPFARCRIWRSSPRCGWPDLARAYCDLSRTRRPGGAPNGFFSKAGRTIVKPMPSSSGRGSPRFPACTRGRAQLKP